MSQSSGSQFERPKCDTKGCDNISTFHGFGVDKCWSCYPRFMELRFGLPNNRDIYRGTGYSASIKDVEPSTSQMVLF